MILKRESSEYEMSLGWLIDHIRLNGIKSKKNHHILSIYEKSALTFLVDVPVNAMTGV
jgi:hypothetical protein